jgi:hypothetical protein
MSDTYAQNEKEEMETYRKMLWGLILLALILIGGNLLLGFLFWYLK